MYVCPIYNAIKIANKMIGTAMNLIRKNLWMNIKSMYVCPIQCHQNCKKNDWNGNKFDMKKFMDEHKNSFCLSDVQ